MTRSCEYVLLHEKSNVDVLSKAVETRDVFHRLLVMTVMGIINSL